MVKVSGMKLKELQAEELQRLNKARSEQVSPYLKRVKINQEKINYDSVEVQQRGAQKSVAFEHIEWYYQLLLFSDLSIKQPGCLTIPNVLIYITGA